MHGYECMVWVSNMLYMEIIIQQDNYFPGNATFMKINFRQTVSIETHTPILIQVNNFYYGIRVRNQLQFLCYTGFIMGDLQFWLTPKQLDNFFQNLVLFGRVVHFEWNIFVWNWSNTINNYSALWILMAWCFSTRASVATVLRMHPCIVSCLWVNSMRPSDAHMHP